MEGPSRLLVPLLAVSLVGACAPNEEARPPERRPRVEEAVFRGNTMGTTFSVKVVTEPLSPQQRETLSGAVVGALDEVNRLMSTYREDSELSRFNRFRETTPFELSPPTFEVFELALDVYARTGGAFDVTVGPLVNLWGFGPEGEPREPGAAEIARALERVGSEHLRLDPATSTVSKGLPEIYCDLSAIAKGYGVDRAVRVLEERGIDRFMVELGGEVRAKGKNVRGQAWQIAVEKPVPGVRALHRIVPLSDRAVATSGDYRNFFDRDGRRFSHTIDPRTGRPVSHDLASVTVVDTSCAAADAWATALNVLGPDEGFEVASEEGLAVLLLVREGDGLVEKRTPPFEAVGSRLASP